MVTFTIAFGIETLVFSGGLSTRLPVSIALAIMILLVSWCGSFVSAARADFGVLARIHVLGGRLTDLARGLRGKVSEPERLQWALRSHFTYHTFSWTCSVWQLLFFAILAHLIVTEVP